MKNLWNMNNFNFNPNVMFCALQYCIKLHQCLGVTTELITILLLLTILYCKSCYANVISIMATAVKDYDH